MSFSDVLGIVSLIVTIAGFAVAIWQVRKSRTATEAATEAMESAEYRMRQNHLLLLVPQLKAVEVELDYACDQEDRKAARRALVTYSQAANQIASLLQTINETDAAFIETLKSSAAAAGKAKGRIATDNRVKVSTAVSPVLELVSETAGRAAGLATEYQMRVAK